jgi:hypothetical protein
LEAVAFFAGGWQWFTPLLKSNNELLLKVEKLEKKIGDQDERIIMIFKYLKILGIPG